MDRVLKPTPMRIARSSLPALVPILLTIGCARGSETQTQPSPTPRKMQDDSTPVILSGNAGVFVRPAVEVPDTRLSGTIASVQPANASPFLSRWGYVTVNVDADHPAPPALFHVLLSPAGVPFPLRGGERISVSILSTGTQVVLGPRGEVLLARIEGNASLPGWRAEKGVIASPPRAPEQFKTWFHVVVSHRGRVAVAAPGQWRRLVTDDGTWLITGSALDTIPPAAEASHFWFAAIRERDVREP